MNRTPKFEITPATQIGMSILVVAACYLLVVLLSVLAIHPLFGVSITQLQFLENASKPEYIHALKFTQIMQSIGLFIVPPLILGKIFAGNSFLYLKINKPPRINMLLLVTCIIAFAIPIVNFIAMLNAQIRFPDSMSGMENYFKDTEKFADDLTAAFMNVTTISGLLINILMMGLLTAIGEELFFRGFLQQMIAGWTKNKHIPIIITGFIFSAIHFQFYGFFPRWLLGMLLGYLFLWSGNLWLPIMAHFMNNSIAVVCYYLVNIHVINQDSIEFGSGKDAKSLFVTLVTTIIMTTAIGLFYKKRKAVEGVEGAEGVESKWIS